jgi:pyrroline-5-carboxylate reductase
MIISIIGSGNTATVLGKMLLESNHTINEIVGRNKITAQQLAKKLNANTCIELNAIDKNSDIYIIAVNDKAVEEITAQLKLNEKIVAHTAGSIAMNVLESTWCVISFAIFAKRIELLSCYSFSY